MGSGPCLVERRQWPTRVAAAREGAIPAKADMLAMLAKALMLAKVLMLAAPAKVAVPARVPMLARVPMPAKVRVPARVAAAGLMTKMGADSLRLTGAD
jgi:hypothetical protein